MPSRDQAIARAIALARGEATLSERALLRQLRSEGFALGDRTVRGIVHRERPQVVGNRRYTQANYRRIVEQANQRPSAAKAQRALRDAGLPVSRTALDTVRPPRRRTADGGMGVGRPVPVQRPGRRPSGAATYTYEGQYRDSLGRLRHVTTTSRRRLSRAQVMSSFGRIGAQYEEYDPDQSKVEGLVAAPLRDVGAGLKPGEFIISAVFENRWQR